MIQEAKKLKDRLNAYLSGKLIPWYAYTKGLKLNIQ